MKRERIESVEIQDLTHGYEAGAPLFSRINLHLSMNGDTMVVQGPPGSGRSLFLKIMAGLVVPNEGRVLYNGQSIHDLSFEEFIPLRLSTAFGFEDGGLLMNKTLEENLMLAHLYHRGWRVERHRELLDRLVADFELGSFLHLRPASLSTSVRKTAGLVRAFLHNAQILFLDEPSLGLGEKALKALSFCIQNHRKEGKGDGLIVIASSDDTLVKNQNVKHVLRLEGGKLRNMKEAS